MNQEEKKKNNFWLGFFLGGLFGAFLLFLFGTKKGQKIIKNFLAETKDFEKDFEKKVLKLQKTGQDFLQNAEEMKEKLAEEIAKGKQNLSSQFSQKLDQTLSKVEDLQKKGVALTQEVRHRYFKRNGKKLSA